MFCYKSYIEKEQKTFVEEAEANDFQVFHLYGHKQYEGPCILVDDMDVKKLFSVAIGFEVLGSNFVVFPIRLNFVEEINEEED